MNNNKKQELISQLNKIESIATKEEWLVFVLAYYERLSIAEIAKVLDKNTTNINSILDNILYKAIPILGSNIKLLG